jgi:hypothetical protein
MVLMLAPIATSAFTKSKKQHTTPLASQIYQTNYELLAATVGLRKLTVIVLESDFLYA